MSYELHQAREDSLVCSERVVTCNDSFSGGSFLHEAIYVDSPGDNVREPVVMQKQQRPLPCQRDDVIMERSSSSNRQSRTLKSIGRTSSHDLVSNYAVSSTTVPFPPKPPKPRVHSFTTDDTIASERKVVTSASTSRSRKRRLPPVVLPAYPGYGPTDCFIWRGNHLEDRLSQEVIKGGFVDKAIMPNESNTARPSLWPHLNTNSGPQSLSSFVVSIMSQRHDGDTVCTLSTFKPPPRVTLTDTKREAWLRDLASESIPLRRLSRTIPHGIRGKILLNQCLAKNIPVWRAVWLAKCVGANELRAFKRKGVSGTLTNENETKWIRDWTSLIENSIENVLSRCAGPEWKAKFDYMSEPFFLFAISSSSVLQCSTILFFLRRRLTRDNSFLQLDFSKFWTKQSRRAASKIVHGADLLAVHHCITTEW